MSTAPVDREELRRELDELAQRGLGALRRAAFQDALARAVDRGAPLVLATPLAIAAWQVVRNAAGLAPAHVSLAGLALATLLVPAAAALGWALWAAARPFGRRAALRAVDEHLGCVDRLLTADELALRARTSDFEEAALADGAAWAERARALPIRLPARPVHLGTRAQLFAIGAYLAFALAAWTGSLAPAAPDLAAEPAGEPRAELAALDAAERSGDAEAPAPRDVELFERRAEAPPRSSEARSESRDAAVDATSQAKEARGRTAAGRSSEARSSSGRSESRGTPSKQNQASKAAAEKAGEREPAPRPPSPAPDDVERKQVDEEESGATAGRGSSRGSNRNPVATDWVSKDQVTTPDDDDLEDDDEVDDEDEEQESRGGIQPNLRDRKPPVSRDLRIGFGNAKSPDGNGRGGPSEQKKSRGVASLVLGVPIPDRIKGQPNAGRTKVTQERIEPEPEEAHAEVAQERAPRTTPAGTLTRPELAPWMRALVQSYFLELRRGTSETIAREQS